ncbi:MAG TPA: N-acetylmuramoyl-L-alanine amidase [Chloroflexota bacterium]|nr:N-acetylmuramoyl-L-alanine amidase [Chloroflexota bacterium]
MVGGGIGALLPSPLGRAQAQSSAWTPRLAVLDGYQTAPPHAVAHAFNAVGAVWPDGAPPRGRDLEVRTSEDGTSWTPWQPLRTEGAGGRRPRSTLLFVPASRLVQYRLPAPAPTPRLVFIDTLDGPTLADLQTRAAHPRLLSTESVVAAQASAPRPAIVSRPEWGAQEAWRWWVPEYRVTHHLAVHHTGASTGAADPAAAVRSVYHYHAVVLEWGDVGYHYLVDWTGTIYEGRYGGPNVVGGHIRGHNPGVEGIAALGNYDYAWPSDSLEQALGSLVAWRAEMLGIDPQGSSLLDGDLVPNVLGHRDAAQTDCPGRRLYFDLGAVRADARRRIGYVPKLAVEIEAFRAERSVVEAGDRLAISVTVRNQGTVPLLPAAGGGPAPAGRAPSYVESDGPIPRLQVPAATLLVGLGTDAAITASQQPAAEADAQRARGPGVGEEGPDAPRDSPLPDPAPGYPYRWSLPRPVAAGESGTLTAYLRLRQLGSRRFGAAVFREAGDVLAEQAPTVAVRVVPAPPALRSASPVASRLAFPWLEAGPAPGSRRLAVANVGGDPADLRWSMAGGASPPTTYRATLSGFAAARWDDANGDGTVAAGPWPSARPTTAAAGPLSQPARDVAAGLLEAAGDLGAAVRLRLPLDDSSGVAPSGLDYVGLAGGAPRLSVPLLGEGWTTELAVQNLGDGPTAAEVTWRSRSGARVDRRQLGPGAAAVFALPSDAQSASVASSTGTPLVGLAVASASGGRALTYPLPAAASAGLLLLPLFGQADGWTSTLQLLNPGDAPAQVVLRWGPYGGSGPWQDGVTLRPGESLEVPRPQGPGLPGGALGAMRIEASGPVVGLAVWRHTASDVYLASPALLPSSSDLVLPLGDLAGLPDQRLLGVQSAAADSVRVALHYYDADGQELDRVVDTLPPGGALAYRPRPAASDAAQLVIRAGGAPLAAALLQSPGP